MEVRDYSLLCNYKSEFPMLKQYFMKQGIPFETAQFNNTHTMVMFSCTPLDHVGVMEFTFENFGW